MEKVIKDFIGLILIGETALLDIRIIRENPELVKKNLEKRRNPEIIKMLEELVKEDSEWRALKKETDELRANRNKLTEEIDKARRAGKNSDSLIKEAKKLPEEIKKREERVKELEERNHYNLMRIPNLLHETVPYGKDDSENVEIKKWGKIRETGFEIEHHGALIKKLNAAEFERAVKISGEGFFYLKGDLALMELALQRLAIDMLLKKGFTLIQPPFLMRRKAYEGVTDLSDFEKVMYKIENEDAYLIATSEHPMGAMYMDEILEEKDLPIKFAGVSACFRREIGKHGLDERGLYRVHQFNKIEQFIFCTPENSWKELEQLSKNQQELMETLEIPYRVVNICTGDIGIVASKKYDVEGYSPREKKYIELGSCSNCTSYQAIRLNIKYRKGQEKEYIHTLNNTMVATPRTLRCIIENYQTKEGTIKAPKALWPYMNGVREIGKP